MTDANQTSVPDEPPNSGGDQTSVAVRIYCQMMQNTLQKDSPRLARVHADAIEFLRRLNPQDPLEQMLAEQILWMNARLAHLNYFASVQTKQKPMQMLHNAADRLANTVRRHMMAFADYRNPGRKRFTAVRQANIAHQQIVTSAAANLERHLDDPTIPRPLPQASTPILSSVPPGSLGAAGEHRVVQTVADNARPENDRGQEALQPEPSDSRPIHS